MRYEKFEDKKEDALIFSKWRKLTSDSREASDDNMG